MGSLLTRDEPFLWQQRCDQGLSPLVLSHRLRGFGHHESSLSALRAALDAGVCLLEIDTRLTRDMAIVVHHDAHLGAVVQGEGYIEEHDLSTLRNRFSFRDSGESIATLDEMLAELAKELVKHRGRRCQLAVDVKDCGVEETYIDLFRQHGVIEHVCITSWTPEVLKRFHALAPTLPLSFSHVSLVGRARAFGMAQRWGPLVIPWTGALGRCVGVSSLAQLERVPLHFDDYDVAPDRLREVERGLHRTHVLSEVVGGELGAILARSGGGIGTFEWLATSRMVDECHVRGLEVRVFSVGSRRSLERLLGRVRPDVVFSDAPELTTRGG